MTTDERERERYELAKQMAMLDGWRDVQWIDSTLYGVRDRAGETDRHIIRDDYTYSIDAAKGVWLKIGLPHHKTLNINIEPRDAGTVEVWSCRGNWEHTLSCRHDEIALSICRLTVRLAQEVGLLEGSQNA